MHLSFRHIALLVFALIHALDGLSQENLLYEDFNRIANTALPAGWRSEIIRGNTGTDSFRVNSPMFRPFGLIEGAFVSFDVYNGGYKGQSNGDGLIEDIALHLPVLHTDSAHCMLRFNYHLVRLRTPVLSVEIRESGTLTWKKLWSDSAGTSLPSAVQIDLSSALKNIKRFELRFRWQTRDAQLTQGYVLLDDVQVFMRKPSDIGIRHAPAHDLTMQTGADLNIGISLVNCGRTNIPVLPYTVNVLRTDRSVLTRISDTITDLKAGSRIQLDAGTFSLSKPGTYILQSLSQRPDDLPSNDTFETLLSIRDSLQKPVIESAVRCGPGTLQLRSDSSRYSTSWAYQDSILAFGSLFNTPAIQASRTYQARSLDTMAGQLQSGQGPYRFTGSNSASTYVLVSAIQSIRLEALGMHFAAAEKALMQVYLIKGSYKGYETKPELWKRIFSDSMQTSSWGDLLWLDIPDMALNSGDSISFCIVSQGNAAFTFKRSAFGDQSEHLLFYSDAICNTFQSNGFVYTGFSWDGAIRYSSLIVSPISEAYANIVDKPRGADWKFDPDFFGIPGRGDSSAPDQLAGDGKAVYRIQPPNAWGNGDFGTTWKIGDLVVRSSGGWLLPDTLYWLIKPNKGKDAQVGLWSGISLIDSTLIIELRIFDVQTGCDTTLKRFVHISKRPIAHFESQGFCAGEMVYFKNQSPSSKDSLQFQWDFGDGAKSFDRDAAYRFTTPGQYRVRLSASNPYGITGIFEDSLEIFPVPRAVASVVHACQDKAVQILPNRKLNPQHTVFSLYGEHGRLQATDIGDTLLHQFASNGRFQILLVADFKGCRDSSQLQAYQFPKPVATFQLEESCQHQHFRFENHSTIAQDEKLGYLWYRNGKLFSTQSQPIATEHEYGVIHYMLITSSQFNCRDTASITREVMPAPKSLFTANLACNNEPTRFNNLSRRAPGLDHHYVWFFGDGTSSSDSSPLHAYSTLGEQQIRLRVTASNGCVSEYDSVLVVRVQPDAKFGVGTVCSKEEAVFLNSSKIENKILKYKWYFGDGDSSELHSPRHRYQTEETRSYRVRLRVYVQDGDCDDEYSEQVVVHRNPECTFTTVPENDPLQIRFTAIDSQIHEYTWSFEGGGFSRDSSPLHRFQERGIYQVRLFARNTAGCQCRAEQDVEVGPELLIRDKLADADGIVLYPNPTRGWLFVRWVKHAPFDIEMENAVGTVVLCRQNVENLQGIDLSPLSRGVYWISLKTQGQTARRRIILN